MRPFGADDKKSTRTPTVWMMPFRGAFPFPVLFSAWLNSSRRYRVILAKRPSLREDGDPIPEPTTLVDYVNA